MWELLVCVLWWSESYDKTSVRGKSLVVMAEKLQLHYKPHRSIAKNINFSHIWLKNRYPGKLSVPFNQKLVCTVAVDCIQWLLSNMVTPKMQICGVVLSLPFWHPLPSLSLCIVGKSTLLFSVLFISYFWNWRINALFNCWIYIWVYQMSPSNLFSKWFRFNIKLDLFKDCKKKKKENNENDTVS